MSQEKNPIYIEYYSHLNCNCYKINLPWTIFEKSTKVLCPVKSGPHVARLMAIGVINEHLGISLVPPILSC